jgi:hypothetical protein
LYAQAFEAAVRGRVAAALTGLALLLGSSRAQAYCREVTASPPNGYDPTLLGCFNGENGGLPGLYWRNQCVGYSFQRNASRQITLADAETVARNAFQTWQNAQCADMVVGGYPTGIGNPAIFATELAPVDCDQVPSQEHNNPIIFRDDLWPYTDTMNAIGYTTLTVDLVTGEILGAAIEINTSGHTIVASGAPPAGAYDLASVLTHEVGHFLGLAHSEQRDAVMFAFYQPNTTMLTPDDVDGICNIYNPTGSRNTAQGLFAATSCDPQPRLGFLDLCGSIDSGIAGNGTMQPSDVGATNQPTADDGGSTFTEPDADTSSGNGDVSTETLWGCTIGHGPGSGPAGRGATCIGLIALGLLGRRARRTSKATAALFSVLALTVLLASPEARASVSVSVAFDDLVQRASAAAVVVPVEQRSVWEDGRIATYTRARVERLVAGRLPREIWVRTLGGAVGRIAQLVEGEATFASGEASLVFVHPHDDGAATGTFGVVEGAQGQFPVVVSGGGPRLAASKSGGALLPPPATTRPAREVLVDQSLEDAARSIGAAWGRAHTVNVGL